MNIIVRQFDEPFCRCRPDTSWEKENKGIWLPEFAEGLSYAPVVFTRIVKAGKCVGGKFVSRYYEGFNFGVLLYVTSKFNDETIVSDYVDHTTLMPHPLYNALVAENVENEFVLRKDGITIYSQKCSRELLNKIEEAICTASQGISLRIGDYIAVELQGRETLESKTNGKSLRLSAEFCENETMDYTINF